MTLVFIGKVLVLEGGSPKNRGQTGSRYIYIYTVCKIYVSLGFGLPP